MSTSTDPTPTLAAALTGLEQAAAAAGLDAATARSEGEALAATIAEPARGAHLEWSEQLGGTRTAEDFFAAAGRGRKWRAAPTTLLSELVVNGSPHAKAYADALVEVCQAATGLGEPSPRSIGNATGASSAQQRSVLPPDPEPEPAPAPEQEPDPAGPGGLPAPETLLRFLNQVNTQQIKDQTARIRDLGSSFLFGRRDESDSAGSTPAGTANPFDLGSLDPHGPGAFSGLPTPGQPYEGVTHNPPPAPIPAEPAPTDPGQPSAPTPPAQAAAPAPVQTAEAPGGTPETAEPESEPRSLDDLLAELDGLIGLERVKREIHRQVAVLKVEQLRAKAGLKSPTITRHLIFTGNPGTGKTTVARLVSGIYRALGLLSKGQLVEVDRSELVAGYLGQTAIKTSEVVASAAGGVLFIDEAYSLSSSDDQYGQEAVDTLVKEMEDRRDDLVVIVAGYPAPMAEFIDHNPGLSSRFRTEIRFEDYDDDELVGIFQLLAGNADYDITDAAEKRFRMILGITPRGSTFGNGRFARNCLEAAIGRHAWRLRDVAEPTLDQLRQLLPEDLNEGDGDEDHPDPATTDEPVTTNPLDEAVSDQGTVPDTAEPDTAEPDTAEPDTAEPDTAVPDTAEPDTAEPDHAAEQEPDQQTEDFPWWASEPETGQPAAEAVPKVTDDTGDEEDSA